MSEKLKNSIRTIETLKIKLKSNENDLDKKENNIKCLMDENNKYILEINKFKVKLKDENDKINKNLHE